MAPPAPAPTPPEQGLPQPGETAAERQPVPGWSSREVEGEFPGLRLLNVELQVGRSEALTGRSPADLLARLRELSNQYRGSTAIAVRREPVPSAYRVFFRHIGLDPEVTRTPLEAAALERMMRGGFLSRTLLEDVLLIALLDTGVPVWALDAERVDGRLGIRASSDGERLGRSADAPPLPAGRLVIADASTPVAILFGRLAAGHEPVAATRRLALFALQVPGVPELYAEEALWMCRAALERV
jgi:DNA/RNA-binding domain of Phe-tRNA-synthetase-like protein